MDSSGQLLILVGGSLLLLGVLSWATYQTALVLPRIEIQQNLLLTFPDNVLRLVLILICLLIARLSDTSAELLGFQPAAPLGDVAWGIGLSLALLLILNLLTWLAVRLFGQRAYSPMVMRALVPRTSREWLLVPLAMITAVLVEELLFRSLLIGGFSRVMPVWLPIVLFSLLFGLMHAPQGPLGLAATGLVNVLLSLLFVWRGSLLAPFVAHYLFNLAQLVLASRSKEFRLPPPTPAPPPPAPDERPSYPHEEE